MKTALSFDNHIARISLAGSFTYEAHRDFKEASTRALAYEGLSEIEIDFTDVDYLDSAALGMLLLLNERAGGRKIVLLNSQGTVKAVFEIANFGKIFEMR